MGSREMKLVMTLKVRDEEDIIEDNLRFHRALGVDFFIVMDNGSVDRTPEVLARYEEAGLAQVLRDETGDVRGRGADWYTQMARMAATEFGADWVINNDADEFWWPLTGTIKEAFASIPDRFGSVIAPRTEFVGRPGTESFAQRLVVREARSRLPPKAAHRADPGVVVLHHDGHEVAAARGDDLWQALRPPGRAVHRSVRGDGADADGGDEDIRLVWAPLWPLRIFHFPLRSFQQFRRRGETLLRHGDFHDGDRFRRLRRHSERGQLEELYDQLLWDDAAVEQGIREGKLVRDERFAQLLPRCPDPLVEPSAPGVRITPKPLELERERAEVQLDSMRLLTRSQRFTMLRLDEGRRRIDELHAANQQLRATLNRSLGRRLLKLARGIRAVIRGPQPEAAEEVEIDVERD
jgi:hypothetical protein